MSTNETYISPNIYRVMILALCCPLVLVEYLFSMPNTYSKITQRLAHTKSCNETKSLPKSNAKKIFFT